MRVIQCSSFLSASAEPLAVGIGNFDGVHRGHRALLDRLGTLAQTHDIPVAVLTFRPHPALLLHPDQAPPLLCDVEDERALLAQAGVQLLVEEPFTLQTARLAPEEFVERYLKQTLKARWVVVGFNFRFGARAAGTARDLVTLGRQQGIEVEVVPAVEQGGEPISSSRIRAAVLEGRMGEARMLLGHPFRLSGAVVSGDGRGRTLGFPTINLAPTTPILPRTGVYAARARLGQEERSHGAAVNIGSRPTFHGQALGIEAHLLDFEGDLYGRRVSLDLLRYLREERRFASKEELIAALAGDVEATRRELAADVLSPHPGNGQRLGSEEGRCAGSDRSLSQEAKR